MSNAGVPRVFVRPTSPSTTRAVVYEALSANLRDLAAMPVWCLADSAKVACTLSGRRQWGGAASGDQKDLHDAIAAGARLPANLVATHREASIALDRVNGRTTQAPAIVDGLAVRFHPGAPLLGIDLDHVVKPDGTTHPYVAAIAKDFGTYAELSRSGRGLHLYGTGTVDAGLVSGVAGMSLGGDFEGWQPPHVAKAPTIALYDARAWRHFVWTGKGWGDWGSAPVRDISAMATRYLSGFFAYRPTAPKPDPVPVDPSLRRFARGWNQLPAATVAAHLGAKRSGSGWLVVCPSCRAVGRQSKDGGLRPSLRIWYAADGVAVACDPCSAGGRRGDLFARVGAICRGLAA